MERLHRVEREWSVSPDLDQFLAHARVYARMRNMEGTREKFWDELEVGMITVPSTTTSDRFVIFYYADGTNEISTLETVEPVTILKIWTLQRANPFRETKLFMMVVLTQKHGVVGIVMTGEHPATWRVIA